MTRARPPKLAVAAWAVAVVAVVLLAVAVAAHLSSGTPAMHMHALRPAPAATRPGRCSAAHLLTKWQLDAVAVAVLVASPRRT